jgi:hypothetical protein
MRNRYRVEGRNMDGINGWFVVDTHHPLYKTYHNENFMSSSYTYGLSMHKQEMIDLADKLNNEATE